MVLSSAGRPALVRRAENLAVGSELHVLPTSAYCVASSGGFAVSLNHPGLDRPLAMPEEFRVVAVYVARLLREGRLEPTMAPQPADYVACDRKVERTRLPKGTASMSIGDPIPEWAMVGAVLRETIGDLAFAIAPLDGRIAVSTPVPMEGICFDVTVHRDGVVELILPVDVPEGVVTSIPLEPTLDGTGRMKACLKDPRTREQGFRNACQELSRHGLDQVAAALSP